MHKYPLAICKNYALKFAPTLANTEKNDNKIFIIQNRMKNGIYCRNRVEWARGIGREDREVHANQLSFLHITFYLN